MQTNDVPVNRVAAIAKRTKTAKQPAAAPFSHCAACTSPKLSGAAGPDYMPHISAYAACSRWSVHATNLAARRPSRTRAQTSVRIVRCANDSTADPSCHAPSAGSLERPLRVPRLVRPAPSLLPPLRDISAHAAFRPVPPTIRCRDSLCPSPLLQSSAARQHQVGFGQAQRHRRPLPDRISPQTSPSLPRSLRSPRSPRAPPYTPNACGRLSFSRSGCPDPSGFPTVHCKLSCPCARDPTAAGLPPSDSRFPPLSPVLAGIPSNPHPYPCAQYSSSPRWLPTSSHQSPRPCRAQPFLFQKTQHEHKHLVKHLLRKRCQLSLIDACTGVSSVIAIPRNVRKSQAISATPRNTTLAVQTFKVTNQYHSK